mgnify:FL=1
MQGNEQSTELGRVLVSDGTAVQVIVSQSLDSGFYGQFIYPTDNLSGGNGLLRSGTVAIRSKQLSLPYKSKIDGVQNV